MLVANTVIAVLTLVLVHDRHGDKHTPGIIRMGMNVHHSVASVSMEALVERRLEATKESRVSLQTCYGPALTLS